MTRETKVGLIVACTFICLLGVVVASKLRRPDADDATRLAQNEPAENQPAPEPEAKSPGEESGDPKLQQAGFNLQLQPVPTPEPTPVPTPMTPEPAPLPVNEPESLLPGGLPMPPDVPNLPAAPEPPPMAVPAVNAEEQKKENEHKEVLALLEKVKASQSPTVKGDEITPAPVAPEVKKPEQVAQNEPLKKPEDAKKGAEPLLLPTPPSVPAPSPVAGPGTLPPPLPPPGEEQKPTPKAETPPPAAPNPLGAGLPAPVPQVPAPTPKTPETAPPVSAPIPAPTPAPTKETGLTTANPLTPPAPPAAKENVSNPQPQPTVEKTDPLLPAPAAGAPPLGSAPSFPPNPPMPKEPAKVTIRVPAPAESPPLRNEPRPELKTPPAALGAVSQPPEKFGEKKVEPVPPLGAEPRNPPPVTTSVPPIRPAGGVEAPPPLGAPMRELPSTPVIGAGPKPAAGPLPEVKVSAEQTYYCKPEDTTFAQLSQRFYGSDKFARALLEYNRRHPLAKSNVLRDPPALTPNQPVYWPPVNILELRYAQFLTASAPAAPPTGSPAVRISTPMPLNAGGTVRTTNPPTADPTMRYRVPAPGQMIFDVARQTLGSGHRWPEIYRLNPSVPADRLIPAGTELRIPKK